MRFARINLFLCACLLSTVATAVQFPCRISKQDGEPLLKNLMLSQINILQEKIRNSGGCGRKICFILDGGGLLSSEEWEAQKFLLELVACAIGVDSASEFAAVQIGPRNEEISVLTGNVDSFLLDALKATQTNARRTFPAFGLAFCIRNLGSDSEENKKIVFLSDARSNAGGNPVPIAKRWLQNENNGICSVGVGYTDTSLLQAISGGDPKNVLTSDSWLTSTDILEDLVNLICDITPDF